MSVETARWGILYCPKTGFTSPRKRWEKIEAALNAHHVQYDMVQSESTESVERLVKMMISNGYKTLIIIGGDSALNDAVNCLMMEEKDKSTIVAVASHPSGEDFGIQKEIYSTTQFPSPGSNSTES